MEVAATVVMGFIGAAATLIAAYIQHYLSQRKGTTHKTETVLPPETGTPPQPTDQNVLAVPTKNEHQEPLPPPSSKLQHKVTVFLHRTVIVGRLLSPKVQLWSKLMIWGSYFYLVAAVIIFENNLVDKVATANFLHWLTYTPTDESDLGIGTVIVYLPAFWFGATSLFFWMSSRLIDKICK